MGTSISSILGPADLIINFLFVPRVIYFCAFFAYDGLKNGVTLTHVGMKEGLIARIYGLLYLLVCILQLLSIPYQLREIFAVGPEDLKNSLTFSIAVPEMGLIFFGLALIIFIFREAAIAWGKTKLRRTTRNIRRLEAGCRFTNWMIAMIIAVGVPPLLGLPHFFTVAVFAFFTYFAPFTSPIAVKKLMSMPIDENKPFKKSVSPV